MNNRPLPERRRNIPNGSMDGVLPMGPRPTNAYADERRSPFSGLSEKVAELAYRYRPEYHNELANFEEAIDQLKSAGDFLAKNRPHDHDVARAGDVYMPDVIALISMGEVSKLFMDRLFAAMPGQTQNTIIRKYGSPTSAFFSHIREQADTVEALLRQSFERIPTQPDAIEDPLAQAEEKEITLAPKEAMNFWFKMQKMISDELPRIVSMERLSLVEELTVETLNQYLSEEQRKEFQGELKRRINEHLEKG